MTTKLKTFVLKSALDSLEGSILARSSPGGGGGTPPSVAVTTLETSEGERAEIASERDTELVGIAMPFTLIEPRVSASSVPEGDSWGIAAVGADGVPDDAGSNVRVAVLDTGIAEHPAFEGLDPIRRNFTEESDDDINGHGTHCAGTIFGQDVDGRQIGIARGVRNPLIGKILGRGGNDSESILRGIMWARDEGADVISMSLGIDFPRFQQRLVAGGRQDVEATSIALQAYRDNVRLFDQLSRMFSDSAVIQAPLLIAASGNESRRPDFTIATAPPAVADDILSVGAIDSANRVAQFSNTGPDCCAPGVDIVSASHSGGMVMMSGTSMATPHVAGIAALEAEKLKSEGRFTARALREAVLAKTVPVPGLDRSDAGRGSVRA